MDQPNNSPSILPISKTPAPAELKLFSKSHKKMLSLNADELHLVSRFLNKDVKPLADPRCLVDLEKNQDRDFYYDYISGAHEGRFDIFNNNPKNLSQYKELPAPSFKKYSKRKPLFLSSARFPIDYRIENGLKSPDPCKNEKEENKATGKHRNLSMGVPEFEKMAQRKFHAP